jgi:hypothetical protein
MAHLQLTNRGFQGRVFALRLGVNRIGRHPEADFQIDDPTVSQIHCELVLGSTELRVRDCDSSNGTFIDGVLIREGVLQTGQVLRLGQVQCFVEDAEIRVSIPAMKATLPSPPLQPEGGRVCCAHRQDAPATHRCPKCKEVMCSQCVKRLRWRGGKCLELCPRCSTPVKRILKTIRIPFAGQDPK